MAPRAFGALFALVAALLFATALAGGLAPKVVPGWWDGHPVVQGRELELKAIHVGLLDAYGCNLGGEIRCEELETNHALDVVGIAELAALGLGAFTALLLALSAARIGDRRRLLAKLLLFEIVLIAAGAATIFIHGPDLRIAIQVLMPVGIGLMAVGGGVGTALLAIIAAYRVRREPLRLKPSQAQIQHQQRAQHQPAFDVRELLREGQGGTPQTPAPASSPSSVPVHSPLFESAPALRPLYDMQNAGAAPTALAPHTPPARPTPPPLEQPTAPVRDEVTPGDSASAHVPVKALDPYAPVGGGGRFGDYSPPRKLEQTVDLEEERVSVTMPPAPESPTAPMRGTQAPRPRVPAPERPARATKNPALVEPPEPSTAVEVDAEAKARYQARLESATDRRPAARRSDSLFDQSDESVIASPIARVKAPTDQNEEATGIFGGPPASDTTSESPSAPEHLDSDIGHAQTELATVGTLTPQQLADLPSSEQPPIDPPPPVTSRPPSKPFGALAPPKAKATPPARPAPPPKPTSLPPPSAPVVAPFSTRESAPTIGIERVDPAEVRESAVDRIERGDPTMPSQTQTPNAIAANAFASSGAPAAPFPVSPSAAHVAPILPTGPRPPLAPLAAKNGPVTASRGLPAPRAGKPSVPPPASTSKFAGLLPKVPPADRPSASAINLESASTSSPSSTSTTPSPFATIPSPFAAKLPPSRPSDEALTRRVEKTEVEEPTRPASPEHERAKEAEAPTQPSGAANAATTEPLPRIPRPDVSTPSDEVATVHASKPAPQRTASTSVQPRKGAADASSPRVISTAPTTLPPPAKAVAATSGPTPACPQCEAPMAWVEEHLRFYCASCRMYF